MNELKKINYKEVCIVSLIGILFLLPFLSSFSYSIDDYHLLGVYNLNIENMGYNYYSTGRFVEGIIAEILSMFNLLPINKPFGQLFFIVSLALLGVYIAQFLRIKEATVRILFSSLFMLNPFLGELYYYSTVTVFCGFATLFLFLGFVSATEFCNSKKKRYAILALVGYYCSLSTYQIFFPIIIYVFVYMLLKYILSGDGVEEKFKSVWMHIGIYIVSFILFYGVMSIAFKIKPPTLQYNMDNVSNMISMMLSVDYWKFLLLQLKTFLIDDNHMNSALVFNVIMITQAIVAFIIIVQNVKKEKTLIQKILSCSVRYVLFEILIGIGWISLAGFSIVRPNELSYRSFIAYSILVALLMYLLYICIKNNTVKKMVLGIMCVLVLVSGIRFGRVALDTHRLNTMENNLANRIVYRLEEFENFNPNAPVVILGGPNIKYPANYGAGNYNTPALAEFSKVLVINEISGYNFQLPSQEAYDKAYQNLDVIGCWPASNSVVEIDGVYIVRFY